MHVLFLPLPALLYTGSRLVCAVVSLQSLTAGLGLSWATSVVVGRQSFPYYRFEYQGLSDLKIQTGARKSVHSVYPDRGAALLCCRKQDGINLRIRVYLDCTKLAAVKMPDSQQSPSHTCVQSQACQEHCQS